MILNDPEYKATRASLDAIQAKIDLFEARQEASRKEFAEDVEKRMEKALSRVEIQPMVQIPQTAVKDAMESVKAYAKSHFRTAMEETLSQLQITEPEITPELATQYADQAMMGNLIQNLAENYPTVPPQVWQIAMKVGLPWLADYLGIPLEEITGQ